MICCAGYPVRPFDIIGSGFGCGHLFNDRCVLENFVVVTYDLVVELHPRIDNVVAVIDHVVRVVISVFKVVDPDIRCCEFVRRCIARKVVRYSADREGCLRGVTRNHERPGGIRNPVVVFIAMLLIPVSASSNAIRNSSLILPVKIHGDLIPHTQIGVRRPCDCIVIVESRLGRP